VADVTKRPIGPVEFDDYLLLQGKNAGLGDEHRARVVDVLNSSRAIRKSRIRAATCGDSIANFSLFANTLLPTSTDFSVALTQVNLDTSKISIKNPCLNYLINGGISGQTSAQLLARDAIGAGVTRKAITDISNGKPDVVFLSIGINDIASVTPGTVDSTVATVIENRRLIYNRLLASGAIIIDYGLLGYSATGHTNPSASREALLKINAQAKALAATLPWVYFLDTKNVIHNDQGFYLDNITHDGLHPSSFGFARLSLLIDSVLHSIFGAPSSATFPGVNQFPDPFLLTVTAESYGTRANIIALNGLGGSGTMTNAQIVHVNGGVWQFVDVETTGASQYRAMTIRLDAVGLVAGQTYGFEFDFIAQPIDPVAIATGVNQINSRADFIKTSGGNRFLWEISQSFVSQMIDGGHIAIGPLTVTEDSASLTSVSLLSIRVGAVASGSKFRMGMGNIRVVNLG
jgi:lysophospholipase L1-like esterase